MTGCCGALSRRASSVLVLLLLVLPATCIDLSPDKYLPTNISGAEVLDDLQLDSLTLSTILFGRDVNRTLGYCNEQGQACRWKDYLWSVVLTGIWAWIIAGAVLLILVIYTILRACCCCFVCIAEGLFGCLTCCCNGCCSTMNNFVIWLVRLLILATVGVGAAGFAFAVMGYLKVDVVKDYAINNTTQFVTVTLKERTDLMVQILQVSKSTLGTVSQLCLAVADQPDVISNDQVTAPATVQQSIATEYLDYKSTYIETAKKAWFFFFWISIIVPMSILAAVLVMGVVMRSTAALGVTLTSFGLLACALVWCAIAVTGGALSAMDDACGEVRAILTDSPTGRGLVNELICGRFSREMANYSSFNDVESAAVRDACGCVQWPCSTPQMSCPTPTLPAKCLSYAQVSRLDQQITITAASGACGGGCSVATCAAKCTSVSLANASLGLIDSLQLGAILNQSQTTVIQPMVTCQYAKEALLVQYAVQCVEVRRYAEEMVLGMFALAIASFVGAITTLFLSNWFDSVRRSTSGNKKDSEPNPLQI
eukprot:EG_transcript_5512